MGEVYRANDLKLNQAVALKFLSGRKAVTGQALARFHNEVRLARQVSHPNVCRVYDIGETEGSVYLSMEYVDGEDLGSLLRRIGRLPNGKALEITRRLCAGLAAAHDKGVLHRDLKPANIMIDGRGQVLITDFGLAAVAGQVEGGEVRNGTPAYMSPEQLAGLDVSNRSDFYSLGLVMYEMFTGRRAFEDHRRTVLEQPSSLVKDIDPTVERLIQTCLESDPGRRPASALAMAAALPGGDRLAAALEAGETPSPQAVAAATVSGAISVTTSLWLMASVLAGLIGVVVLGSRINLLRITPFEKSADELAARSRDVIREMGYPERPADTASGFEFDSGYFRLAQTNPAMYRKILTSGLPAPIYFWYRQSRDLLSSPYAEGVVLEYTPPEDHPGMVDINLDPEGRLTYFIANPPAVDPAPDLPVQPVDWNRWFAAAGLDAKRFTPSPPRITGQQAFDQRLAWTGSMANVPEMQIRVEAASWKGRPVRFWPIFPWQEPYAEGTYRPSLRERVQDWLYLTARFGGFLLAVLLAVRNYRLSRSDTLGAVRLAVFVFGASLLIWVFQAKHHADVREYYRFARALSESLFAGATFGVLYLGLEPYVRRRWPRSLISWTRLLAGGVRDPVVGAHLLIGTALGICSTLFFFLQNLLIEPIGSPVHGPTTLWLVWVSGLRDIAGATLFNAVFAIGLGLLSLFLLFLGRTLLPTAWLGVVVLILAFSTFYGLRSSNIALGTVWMAVQFAFLLTPLMRFGVLEAICAVFVSSILGCCPMTTDFSAWYAGNTAIAIALVLALAVYGFHTAVAGRPLGKLGFLEG